jgi:hypothetical protein
MPITLPGSPTVGQQINVGSSVYTYNGQGWAINAVDPGYATTQYVDSDYLYVARLNTSAVNIGLNSDIIFESVQQQKNIAYNAATGLFTLTAGKMYEIRASLSFGGYTDPNAWMVIVFVNSANTSPMTPRVAMVGQPENRNTNESNRKDCSFLFSPTATSDFKFRVVESSGHLCSIRAAGLSSLLIKSIR